MSSKYITEYCKFKWNQIWFFSRYRVFVSEGNHNVPPWVPSSTLLPRCHGNRRRQSFRNLTTGCRTTWGKWRRFANKQIRYRSKGFFWKLILHSSFGSPQLDVAVVGEGEGWCIIKKKKVGLNTNELKSSLCRVKWILLTQIRKKKIYGRTGFQKIPHQSKGYCMTKCQALKGISLKRINRIHALKCFWFL